MANAYDGVYKFFDVLIKKGNDVVGYVIMPERGTVGLLENAVEAKDRSRGKKHEVWKADFDVKVCRTEKFLLQKLNYIHNKPVRGKWHLSQDHETYVHSSCLFYFTGKQRHCKVVHYKNVIDWEHMYSDDLLKFPGDCQ